MKKITTTRKANRRPARERKDPSGVQNQLSKRRSTSASRKGTEKLDMNTTFEQQINEGTEVTTAEAPKNQKAEFTRGQLGKAKRAFAKAGKSDASEEVLNKWLTEIKEANIAVMDFTSSRLAKVIKGEVTVSELQK
jgi:hypothetical protein